MNDIIGFILIALGSLLVGFVIGRMSKKVDGLFIVDDSDEQTTRWILDVSIDPDTIPTKKEIRLKVKKTSGVV